MEISGFEPEASRMQSERSTTELYPPSHLPCLISCNLYNITSVQRYHVYVFDTGYTTPLFASRCHSNILSLQPHRKKGGSRSFSTTTKKALQSSLQRNKKEVESPAEICYLQRWVVVVLRQALLLNMVNQRSREALPLVRCYYLSYD